uniref:Uncharacterized protein n=1 Tax=Hanusia phi TaxID=3032 RepID=A0A7S0ECJ8_9CRYP
MVKMKPSSWWLKALLRTSLLALSSAFVLQTAKPASNLFLDKSLGRCVWKMQRQLDVNPPTLRRNSRCSLAQTSMSSNLLDSFKRGVIMALAVVALFLSPGDALAAKSGGRVAGSGFRAGVAARSSMKSSSVRSAVKSPAQRQIGGGVIVAPPPLSPLGYSPLGLSPFGLRPFFYAPLLTDVVVLGGVAYAGAMAYNMFENARQGRTSGINIAKVQVAVCCDNRGPSSLLGTVERLARECDSRSQSSMANLVSDVSLALLRREVDWVSAAVETKTVTDITEGENICSQMSFKERMKVERETFNLVAGKDKSEARGSEAKLDDIGKSTIAVITMVVAMEGKKLPEIRDSKSLKEALMSLGTEALHEDTLVAAELLWVPEEPWESLTPDDIMLEYPNLLSL